MDPLVDRYRKEAAGIRARAVKIRNARQKQDLLMVAVAFERMATRVAKHRLGI
jgi:hypothetical protein